MMKNAILCLTAMMAALLFLLFMGVFMPVHAADCQKLDVFIEQQNSRFPDLIITKLDPAKAESLTKFVNKYAQLHLTGDVVIVGTYTLQTFKRVGYAIFDAGCMVYGEAISAEDWQSVQPLIFGKNT